MVTIAFDTLKFVKRLKAAGFAEDQAEARRNQAHEMDAWFCPCRHRRFGPEVLFCLIEFRKRSRC